MKLPVIKNKWHPKDWKWMSTICTLTGKRQMQGNECSQSSLSKVTCARNSLKTPRVSFSQAQRTCVINMLCNWLCRWNSVLEESTINTKQSDQLDAETEVVCAINIKSAHQSNLGGPECIFVKSGIQSALTLCIKSALCEVDNESEWERHNKDQSWTLV